MALTREGLLFLIRLLSLRRWIVTALYSHVDTGPGRCGRGDDAANPKVQPGRSHPLLGHPGRATS